MRSWNEFTPEQQKEIDTLVLGRQKIEAIKLYREWAEVDLKQAKDAVDAREAELRQQSPELFAAQRSGCFGVLLLAALLAIVICASARAWAQAPATGPATGLHAGRCEQ